MQERKKALKQTLYELEQKYCITDKVLLVKSFAVVAVVIVLFFLSGVIPNFLGLGVCLCACQPHNACIIMMYLSRMDCHIWSSDIDCSVRHQGPGGGDAQD